jgi:anthranilate synthase/indole-3-glycerol phosphate synthase/phosphoribosylanthranilate isomerase
LAALSGIKTRADVETYGQHGAKAVLVGETLMKSTDPSSMIHELLGTPLAMPSRVCTKICGIRDPSSAIAAVENGADMVGLVFAKSKRKLLKEDARAIVRAMHLHPSFHQQSDTQRTDASASSMHSMPFGCPTIVGVFMNQSVDFINEIAQFVGLDLIQLHGEEDDAIISRLNRPVIRAIPVVQNQTTVHDILNRLKDLSDEASSNLFAVLLDTKLSTINGGTGVTFDWNIAAQISTLSKVNIIHVYMLIV